MGSTLFEENSSIIRIILYGFYPLFSPNSFSLPLARKQEIIKVTEQLIEAINNGDFEAYT